MTSIMVTVGRWAAVAVVLVATTFGVAAQQAPSVVSAWVAAPAAGATTASVYLEVANPTMYEIYVTSATTEAAGKVEFRAAASAGAEPAVVPEFAVPAFGSSRAEAGAAHMRLVGLSRPLAAGDSVRLTLTTDGGLNLAVTAPVRQP